MLESPILNFLHSVTITDWVLLIIIIIFAVIGFIRGGAKIIIHNLWSIIGLILAGIFYQELSILELFDPIVADTQIVLLLNFIAIFLAFILLKLAIYKLLKTIANIHGPCPLNRFLALVIGFGLAVVISWYIAMDIDNLEILYRLVTNDFLRIFIAFITAFSLLVITTMVLSKLLNIKVGIDKPCPLLVALQPLDGFLNAKNINSKINNFEGIIFGILQGLIIIILLIIINNHTSLVEYPPSQILSHIQVWASSIQNVLSEYLLFIDEV